MRTDRIAGGVIALLGAAVALEASTFEVAFLTDPVGPKALPLLTAGILMVCGAVLAVRPGDEADWPVRAETLRLAGAVLALAVYAVVLPVVGFVPATILVVTALSLLFGGKGVQSVTGATLLSVILWYLFVWALRLPLPLGTLWEVLWTR
jgi:putative tricarboxylic transport membrane protein